MLRRIILAASLVATLSAPAVAGQRDPDWYLEHLERSRQLNLEHEQRRRDAERDRQHQEIMEQMRWQELRRQQEDMQRRNR
jgi:hypothetical protein